MSSTKPLKPLLLERLEDRILLNAAPLPTPDPAVDVIIDPDQNTLINEQFDFSITLENQSTTPDAAGFQPYVDVIVPAGVDIVSASGANQTGPSLYWDAADGQWEDASDGSGAAVTEHPLTTLALAAGVNDGDTLLIFEYPFGSFVPGQPAGEIEFVAQLDPDNTGDLGNPAEVATPLNISATGGFARGADQNFNPTTDPPIIGCIDTEVLTPSIIELTKRGEFDEEEIQTGPNYPITYTLELNIADGQTVSNANIADSLPAGFVITSGNSVNVVGATPDAGSDLDPTDGSFSLDFSSITAAAEDDVIDVTVTYTGYFSDIVADNNGNGNDDTRLTNDSSASVVFNGNTITDNEPNTDVAVDVGIINIQKSVAITTDTGSAGVTPGDTLTYTLTFAVSDYTSFKNIVLQDLLGDGLTYVDNARYSVTQAGVTSTGSIALANQTTSTVGSSTNIEFRLSEQLILSGGSGVVVGGLAANPLNNVGPATGFVTFDAQILQDFSGVAGDTSVDIGDTLINNVTITGTATDPAGVVDGDVESDDSDASVSIDGGSIKKAVVAIDNIVDNEGVGVGQSVTYRLTFTLPSADVENFSFTDYLPLPVFNVASIETAGGLSFDATLFDPANPATEQITLPPEGVIRFTTQHNLGSFAGVQQGGQFLTPIITPNTASNTYEFDFGIFDSADNGGAVIDLVFTLPTDQTQVSDGLQLTNQVLARFNDTSNSDFTDTSDVQITLRSPDIEITKSVVSVDRADLTNPESGYGFADPGNAGIPFTSPITTATLTSDPIDSDLSGIDAGDSVKFAIVIHNTGALDAHDLRVSDLLPAAGFDAPTLGNVNLQIYSGDGTLLSTPDSALDLFGAGITITDPAGNAPIGALDVGYDTMNTNVLSDDLVNSTGSNIIIITYDLVASADIDVATVQTNTATLEEFAGLEGGNDLIDVNELPQWEDEATTETSTPEITKFFVSSSEPSTPDSPASNPRADVTVGEVITYDLLVTVPEGEIPNLSVRDVVPSGTQFVAGSAQIITAAANTTNLSSDFVGAVSISNIVTSGSNGARVNFQLDGNAGSDVFASEDNIVTNNSFVIRYSLLVLNDLANSRDGDRLINRGRLLFTDNDGADNDPASGSSTVNLGSNVIRVEVVEPDVAITKNLVPPTADAGDVVTITLTVNNTGSSDAFDVIIEDFIDPAKFTNVTEGTTPVGFTYNFNGTAANTVTYSGGTIADSASATFIFTATLSSNVVTSETLTNTATITQSTSLPGADPNERNEIVDDPSADHSAQDTLDIPRPSAVKNFIGTSINDNSAGVSNDNTEAVVGENVTYELVVTLPEGQVGNVTIADTLDTGLAFVELVSITASSADISTTLGAGDFSDVIPPAPGANPFISAVNNASNQAQQIVFNLGNITNADTENGTPVAIETITIRYVATVLNIPANQSTANETGPALGNSAVANFDVNGTPTADTPISSATDVSIIEPVLSTSKSVTVGGGGNDGDAGDTVTYTIRVEHDANSETAAYDVDFSDDIPDDIIILPTGFAVASNAGVTATDFNFNPLGNVITTVNDIDLELGEFFEITVTGVIDATISTGQNLSNTATSTWSSQDGALTNTSEYVTDSSSGERNGDNGPAGLNSYSSSDSAIITIGNAKIDKLDPVPGNYTIGDIITYRILVNLSEGVTEDLVLVDNLPAGLSYVPGSVQVITSATSSSGLLTADYVGSLTTSPTITAPGGNGADVILSFGDTNTTNDNIDNNNAFVVELQAQVLNIASNQSSLSLSNAADLQFTDPVSGGTVTVDDPTDPVIQIIEPDLLVEKTLLTSSANVEAGDMVQYQIQVRHSPTSNADAFDINLADDIPAFLENVSLNSALIGVTNVSTLFNITAVGDLETIEPNSLDLALGNVLTLVIEGTVVNSINPTNVISNETSIDWTSQDDNPGDPTNSDERGGNGVGPDDYNDSDAAPDITVPGLLDVVKTVNATDVTIGDILTYTLTVNVSEGTITGLDINDTLPTGFVYQANSAQIINQGDITFPGVNFTDLQASGNVVLGAGNVLQIDITSLTNPGASNATTNDPATLEIDSFQIQYQVLVDNDSANSNGATKTNDADVSADDGLEDNDNQVEVTLEEPQLETDKNLLTSSADVEAGDTVSYEIIVGHTPGSTADAFDLNVTDNVPDVLQGVTITAFIGTVDVGPTGTGVIFLDGSGDIATVANGLDLAQGESLRVVITGTVSNDVTAGQVISNLVALTWTGQDGDVPGERTGDGNGNNDYNDTDPADNIFVPVRGTFTVEKLADTINATVGDIVTYTLRVTVFEGTTNNIQILDTLPDGLIYQAGSAVVANANGVIINGFNATLTGQTLDIDINSAVNPGDVDNAAGLDTDVFEITYQVLLANTTEIQNGDTKTNDADATADGVPGDVNNQVDVQVIEPQLNIEKDLLTPTSGVTAGDTVTYQVTISHLPGSTTDAFDLNITDDIPDILNNVVIDSALINGLSDVSSLLNINASNDLETPTPNSLDLALGETLVIRISGNISIGLGPTDVISNVANVTWSGQDGDNSNERSGDGLGENDYNDLDSAENITAANTFSIDKTADATIAAIGDVVTYTLSVTPIVGTSNNIQVIDTLPPGFLYQAGTAQISDANGMTITGFSAAITGQILTIDIASVANPSGPNFEISYQVLVANDANNQNGVSKTNDADATADNVPADVDNQVSVTVVEPQLQINKNLLSADTQVDAGDTVQYEIIVQHTGTSAANAFDLNITDDFPAILENVVVVSATIGAADVSALFNINATNDLETPDPNALDLAQGSTLRIVVEGQVADSVNPGDIISNAAEVTWSSQDGVDPNERGGNGIGANDYNDSDPADNILVPGLLEVTKLADTTMAVIGDLVTYTLQVTVFEGTTNNLQIVDTIPGALLYQTGTAQISNANGLTINGFTAIINGQVLTISISDVLNPGDVDAAATLDGDTFEITYQVLVENDPANQSGDIKTNDADVTAAGVPGDFDNMVDVTIAEPKLEITKSASDDTPHYADVITYTVLVEHDQDSLGIDSTADAFDIFISDLVSSPGLTLVDNSVIVLSTTGSTNVVVNNQVGTIAIAADSIALGGQIEFSYQVVVTNDPVANPPGTTFSNTVELDYDTQAGNDPNERDLEDESLEQVTVIGADLAIVKDDATLSLTPGSSNTYTITILNNGGDVATDVTVIDTLPTGVTFNSASNGGTETDGIVTWNTLPNIPTNGSLVLTLTVDIDDPAPAGITSYLNEVKVTHKDIEPTPDDNEDTDEDLLDGAPDLTIDKVVLGSNFAPDDPVQYTITVNNLGNQNTSGVTLIDTFPGNVLTFDSASPDIVSASGDFTFINFDGTFITFDLDVVEAGETITIDIFSTVKNPLPPLITDFTNVVDVSDDGTGNPDSDLSNNNAAAFAEISGFPDIAVEKTNNTDRIQPLDTVTYTINVSNQGDQTSTGIVVRDTIDVSIFENIEPGPLFLTSFNPATGDIVWTIPLLSGSGGSVDLTVTADVKINIPPGIDMVSNTVVAMDDGTNGPDPDLSNNDDTDTDELIVYAFDGIRDEVFRDEDEELRKRVVDRFRDPLNITTFYSGWTEPGSTLKFKIFDKTGNSLGEQIVVADTAGNWAANFANVYIADVPHDIRVTEDQPIYNSSTQGSFNLRTYFAPAHHGQVFFLHNPTVESVFSNKAENVNQSIHHALTNPIQLGWSNTYGYESLISSTTTTQARE